jgi:endogenous inhibitor of DNA gyrase (YacG/DUF329 family)
MEAKKTDKAALSVVEGAAESAPSPASPRKKKCPICHANPDNLRFLPFCSERCKDVDLNRWLSESYIIR